MKIYTRTGDKGETGLFGGKRVPKSSLRMHAYGTLDELNACLGTVLTDKTLPAGLRSQLGDIQATLFSLGADLATPLESKAGVLRTDPQSADILEQWIDAMETEVSPLTQFIAPGGSATGAQLHLARTICRRAERWIVQLKETEPITEGVIVYVNRLSDYLFVAARWVNKTTGVGDVPVVISRKKHG